LPSSSGISPYGAMLGIPGCGMGGISPYGTMLGTSGCGMGGAPCGA